MSYYANGGGSLTLRDLNKDEMSKLFEAAKEFLEKLGLPETEMTDISDFPDIHGETSWFCRDLAIDDTGEEIVLSFSADENFCEDSWFDWLNAFAQFLVEGDSVEFVGEDGLMWRYVIDHSQPAHWREDDGAVIYALTIKEKAAELLQLISDTLASDNCQSTDYISALNEAKAALSVLVEKENKI